MSDLSSGGGWGTMGVMQHSIPEDDWVSAEAEALLDATPGLRDRLRRMVAAADAGTLRTVDHATARAVIEQRIRARKAP